MNTNFISNTQYLHNVSITFKSSKQVINFINSNDINRIKRYLPYSKNDWASVNFNTIIKRIEFDALLRMNIFNITSSVELTFKSILTECIYKEYADNFIYNKVFFFVNAKAQKDFKDKINQIKSDYQNSPNDVFLKKYFNTSKVRIPISAIIQKLTFGETIFFMSSFNIIIKQAVAKAYGYSDISSFITNIKCAKTVRNACCHNDVLNNKKYHFMPNFSLAIKQKINYYKLDNSKLFVQLYNLKTFCFDTKVWNKTIKTISNAFKKYTKNKYIKPLQQFGFPYNWEALLK